MIATATDQTTEHFRLLFEGVADGYLAVSWVEGKHFPTRCFPAETGLGDAAAFAKSMPNADVYIRLCPTDKELEKYKRGSDGDSRYLTCLWMDIDTSDGEHKTEKPLPTKAQARDLLPKVLPHKPSLIIDSGGGLHVYYLLIEPMDMHDPIEGPVAVNMLARFKQACIDTFEANQFHIDNTFQPSRVLRVAGSLNHKTTPPKPAIITDATGHRYDADDLLEALPALKVETVTTPGSESWQVAGGLVTQADVATYGDGKAAIRQAVADMLRQRVADGNDGSSRLFSYCCRGVDAGLPDADILTAVRHAADVAPFPRDYSDTDIGKRIDDARKHTGPQPVERKTFRNVRLEPVLDDDGKPITDDDGNDKLKAIALTPGEVRDNLVECAGEVYTLGDAGPLFVPTGHVDGSPVRILKDPPDLFAHVKTMAEVRWSNKASEGGEVLSKAELHSTLRAYPSAVYDAVATLPHHPPMGRTFYATPTLPPPTGEALQQLVDRLNPETEQDRLLLLAAIMTPAWGGPCGARPMIVLTSDHGRGAGKTKTAEAIGRIYGGITTVSLETRDGIDRLRQRLLAPDSIAIRAVCIDNVKSSASSGEIESLITADTIDGHRLHHGNARRPNNLTWMLTANGIGLSRDLADRSVVIKLGKPKGGDFVTWAGEFIEKNRLQIIADIIGRLKGPPLGDIASSNRDRWGAWQDAVLCRVGDADALARLIVERRGGLDQDAEDWAEVQHEVEALVDAIGGDALRPVAVPSNVLCERLEHVTSQRFTGRGLATMLARFNGVGEAHRLVKNPSRAKGRTYLWMPDDGTLDGTLGNEVFYPNWRGFNTSTMTRG